MPKIRFAYVGEGPSSRAFSGAITPTVRRVIGVKGFATRGSTDGPLFGARQHHQPRAAFELVWPNLTHEEARAFTRQHSLASGGTAAMLYTPDDQTEPMTVVSTTAPEVIYLTAAIASVRLMVEEQR